MNDRLKELYTQVCIEQNLPFTLVHNSAYMMDVFANKFAELIVQECANHCDLLLDHKISSEWSRGTHDCSRAIKKHFGVE